MRTLWTTDGWSLHRQMLTPPRSALKPPSVCVQEFSLTEVKMDVITSFLSEADCTDALQQTV